jgi:hypothetical protein
MQSMEALLARRAEDVSAAVVAKIDETYVERASMTAREAGQVHNDTLKRTLSEEMDKRDTKLRRTLAGVMTAVRAMAASAQAQAAIPADVDNVFALHLDSGDDISETSDDDDIEDVDVVEARVEAGEEDGEEDGPEDAGEEDGPEGAPMFNQGPRPNVDEAYIEATFEARGGPHWTIGGRHFHRTGAGAGESWATPLNYAFQTSMCLRSMVHLYLNGDATNQVMPLGLVKRRGLVTLKEKNRLSKTHAFFAQMASLLLNEGGFCMAERRRRVKVSVVDGIVDDFRVRLTQVPFEFIASRIGRSREGHGRIGVSCSFGSLCSWCSCAFIMKMGTEPDKLKLREMGGCRGHTNGKGCKICRALNS